MIPSEKLQYSLNNCIEKYVVMFERKHELYFEFWEADKIGTIACFSNEYYVSFDDIRTDLEQDAPDDAFFDWYELTMNMGFNGETAMNYDNYLKRAIAPNG